MEITLLQGTIDCRKREEMLRRASLTAGKVLFITESQKQIEKLAKLFSLSHVTFRYTEARKPEFMVGGLREFDALFIDDAFSMHDKHADFLVPLLAEVGIPTTISVTRTKYIRNAFHSECFSESTYMDTANWITFERGGSNVLFAKQGVYESTLSITYKEDLYTYVVEKTLQRELVMQH